MKQLVLLMITLLSTAIMQGSDFDRKPGLNADLIMKLKDCPGISAATMEEFEYANYLDVLSKDSYNDDFATEASDFGRELEINADLIMKLKDCPGVLAATVEEFEYANYLDVLSKDSYSDDFATKGKQIIIGINQLVQKQKTASEQVAHAEMLAQKQKRIENAQRLRATRVIQRKQRGEVSIPTVEIEKITTSLFHDIYPTTQDIKKLIMEQYLKSTQNKDITVKAVDPRHFDERIYCVSVRNKSVRNKPVFFLKINNNGSAKRLIAIQQSSIGRLGIESRYESRNSSIPQKNLPIIAWVEKIYTYTDKFNKDQTIEVIHAARGQMISTILEKKPLEEKSTCITATGKALGSFQQFFMDYNNSNNPENWKTVSHGDFHVGNIFFNAPTSQIYFIDNETMQNQQSIFKDFDHFIGMAFYQRLYNDMQIFDLYKSFIKGYIESFPADKQPIIAASLKNHLTVSYLSKLKYIRNENLMKKRYQEKPIMDLLDQYNTSAS